MAADDNPDPIVNSTPEQVRLFNVLKRRPDDIYVSQRIPRAADVLDAVRQVFTPEVVVPSLFTVRKPVDRGTQATLQPYLLDYSQASALKSALNLSDEGKNVVRDFHLRLINGVAGSGKSLIVIYRAHMLRNMFPSKRILVLTHNRALINDLRQQYDLLSHGDKKTKFHTFNQWCRRYWPKSEDELFRDFVSHKERLHVVEQVWMEDLAKTAVSPKL